MLDTKEAPKAETKKDKTQTKLAEVKPQREPSAVTFRRLTPQRVENALKRLRMIEACARYDHTDAEAERVIGALAEAVGRVKNAFAVQSAGQTAFKL